jgi:hypothetical protein
MVAGRWKAPRAGDRVSLPGGGERTWESATARNGAIEHPALRGGYAYWQVKADAPRIMVLEASGHLMAHVNGEPRAGDPYQNGIVRLPVQLHKGSNDFLFHVGRGRLQAKLTAPTSPALLDTRDLTLPDHVRGEKSSPWAAVVVLNARTEPAEGLRLAVGTARDTVPVPRIPPLGVRKIAFRLPPPPPEAADTVPVDLELRQPGEQGKERALDRATVRVRVRRPDEAHKRTFLSGIDGSVQYYAVQPARPAEGKKGRPALVLTLHGAGVEAIGQASAYAGKDCAHIVAPTNRRPFGFDWEDWGRLDALEVLALAREQLDTDPQRTYLTGHSMGGHGTWHVGLTFPDHFAAIAPSAGWISFWTYGAPRPETETPMQKMLARAISPSDTLMLARNCAHHGVYVLHGEADDNVPVGQARHMRHLLGEFHPDFAYHERPGAGHWWGNACVDWPPLFDFLACHTLPRAEEVRQVDFLTASPGVSARVHWATIEAQIHSLQFSAVHLRVDPGKRRFSGTTDNVSRLRLDLVSLKAGAPLAVELDGQKVEGIPWPTGAARLWLKRDAGKWAVAGKPAAALKGPHRYGPFKEVFNNRVVLVYGTRGSPEENAWALAKARFDAETFWYRGNGSVEVVPDTAFQPAPDRNVVLYGHADSNAVWKILLGDSPVQVRRGVVKVGERKEMGDDLACLFVRPRPGSDRALVAAVSGSGLAGLRLTDRLGYFVSGCGYPDCLVLGPEVLTRGTEGVRAAGFFGIDWGLPSGEFQWRATGR